MTKVSTINLNTCMQLFALCILCIISSCQQDKNVNFIILFYTYVMPNELLALSHIETEFERDAGSIYLSYFDQLLEAL